MYGNNLKLLRERVGLTQQELANILNIGKSQYCLYENEKAIIPIKHLNTLANYFDISLDYLFGFTDVKKYDNYQPNINKDVSKLRIKDFRKKNKLTQVKLASLLNIANGTIAEYERGTNIIATPFLFDICKKYNISADYILGRIDFIPDWCNKNN